MGVVCGGGTGNERCGVEVVSVVTWRWQQWYLWGPLLLLLVVIVAMVAYTHTNTVTPAQRQQHAFSAREVRSLIKL